MAIESVPRWTLGDEGEVEYSGTYSTREGGYHTHDGLPEMTKRALAKIEQELDRLGGIFLENCCGYNAGPSPLVHISTDEDEGDAVTSLPLYNDIYLCIEGQKASSSKTPRLKVSEPNTWNEKLKGDIPDTILASTAKNWLDTFIAESPENLASEAINLARDIWLNSIAGEYGNSNKVGLIFLLHQNAVYQYQKHASLNEDKAMALRECMRVKEGNQQIAIGMQKALSESNPQQDKEKQHKVILGTVISIIKESEKWKVKIDLEKRHEDSSRKEDRIETDKGLCSEAYDYIIIAYS